MLIQPHHVPEVTFGTLEPGDVFVTRAGDACIKIRPQIRKEDGDDVFRFNVLVLAEQPWVTWENDGAYVRYHPDAVLQLGPSAEVVDLNAEAAAP